MATQKDLDVLKQKLSDLDAKLKSMRGNSPQKNPNFDLAMANQNYQNLLAEQRARMAAQQGQFTQGRLMGAPSIQGSPFSRDEDYYNSRYELQELNDLVKKSSGKNKPQIIPTAEIPPKGAIKQNVGSKSINPDYNPEVARKWQEKVRKNLYEQAAKYVPKNDLIALQSKYNDYTSRVPQYVGEGNEPEMTPEQYAEGNKFMEANIARIIAQNPNAKEFLPKPIGSIQGMSKAQQEAIRQFQYNQFITKSREGSQTQNQPPPAPIPPSGGLGGLTADQAGISPEQRKILDALMARQAQQPNPNAGKPLYFQALEGELQKQFLDKNPQLKPKPGTALNPQLIQENYAKFLQNQMAEVNKFNAANPQYTQDIRQPNPILARQSEQSFLEGLLDYSKVSPDQVNVLNQLKSSYLNEGQGGATRPPIPQNQQMATYNNLLQQGIQRSNTMNQDAATNFANMQAGAPIPQPATPAKANPTMPIAGMGMQQPKATPAPRKFSTPKNLPARFG